MVNFYKPWIFVSVMGIIGGLQELVTILVAGLVAGVLADYFVKGVGYGLAGDLVIGVIGAFIGGTILGALGFSGSGFIAVVITAFLGAVLLLWIIKAIKNK